MPVINLVQMSTEFETISWRKNREFLLAIHSLFCHENINTIKNDHTEAGVGVRDVKMKKKVYWHFVVVNLHVI